LIVDANAPLSPPISPKRLQPIAGQDSQISKRNGCIQAVEPRLSLSSKAREFPYAFSVGEASGTSVAVRLDHSSLRNTY
jgi:hypothetical protein